jgi:hypothetical protein
MSSTPKTIQISLSSGKPHSIRIAEITTRIVWADASRCWVSPGSSAEQLNESLLR